MKSVFLTDGLFMEWYSVYTRQYKKEKKVKLFYTNVSHYWCNQLIYN